MIQFFLKDILLMTRTCGTVSLSFRFYSLVSKAW